MLVALGPEEVQPRRSTPERPAFPHFSLLPLELQREIWHKCLPTRAVELSKPGTSAYNRHSHAVARRVPVIAHVCAESRTIAMRHSTWWRSGGERPSRVWLDTSRDIVVLNSDRGRDYLPSAGSLMSAIPAARGGIAVPFEVMRTRGRWVYPLLCNVELGGPRMVYFDELVVCGTRAQVADTGLFGAAAEAGMAFVDLDDYDTLRRIRALDRRRDGARVGCEGFIKGLLIGSQVRQNQRMLEEAWLRFVRTPAYPHLQPQFGSGASTPMPPVCKQVVVFRPCDETQCMRRHHVRGEGDPQDERRESRPLAMAR